MIVTDLHLPPSLDDISEGLALKMNISRGRRSAHFQVVVITGSDSKRVALEAVKHGAYGFFESFRSIQPSSCIS